MHHGLKHATQKRTKQKDNQNVSFLAWRENKRVCSQAPHAPCQQVPRLIPRGKYGGQQCLFQRFRPINRSIQYYDCNVFACPFLLFSSFHSLFLSFCPFSARGYGHVTCSSEFFLAATKKKKGESDKSTDIIPPPPAPLPPHF